MPDPAAIATSAEPPRTERAEARRAAIERQVAGLERLADKAMAVAEATGDRACAPPEPGAPGADPVLAFTRAARAVRLTVALQARIVEDLAALDEADDANRTERADARRERVYRQVERAIDARYDDEHAHQYDRLTDDAWDRLNEADDAEVLDRPFPELVAGICRDLDLSPDWDGEGGDADIPLPGALARRGEGGSHAMRSG